MPLTQAWPALLAAVITTFLLGARMGLLSGFLLAAVLSDTATRKIPNKLVLVGIMVGMLSQSFLPEGDGAIQSLKGLWLGFILFLPMYLIRVMGAGDVKLLAMVGTFAGYPDIFGVALCTLISGGVLSLIFALRLKALHQLSENIKLILLMGIAKAASGKTPIDEASINSVGTLPYAWAIALGTGGYFAWHFH